MVTRASGTGSIAHTKSPASATRCATARPAGPPPTTARYTGRRVTGRSGAGRGGHAPVTVVVGTAERQGAATAAPWWNVDRVPCVAAPNGPSSLRPSPRPILSCAAEIRIGTEKVDVVAHGKGLHTGTPDGGARLGSSLHWYCRQIAGARAGPRAAAGSAWISRCIPWWLKRMGEKER
jgi:hypothetical protein